MNKEKLPMYIALCGHPSSGKNEVASIMYDLADYKMIDVSFPLKAAVPFLFGIDATTPYTQEGKSSVVCPVEDFYEVRQLLGDLGKWCEDTYGENFLAYRAMDKANKMFSKDSGKRFVFSAVRGEQGWFYKRQGAIIIQVNRPSVEPTVYTFDKWNHEFVDYTIENDGGIEQLQSKVESLLHIMAE